MATIGIAANLLDFAKRQDGDGKIAKIIELLEQQNPVLKDMLWVEGNLPTGHRTTVRTGLPSVAWRKLNYGVQPSKSTTTHITDSCAMLEAYAEVDSALADLNGNASAWRLSEDMAFLEAMNQKMAETVFYGDETTPEQFVGFTPRYSKLSGVDSAKNVINALGNTANKQTSIWVVTWDSLASHGIFPKGSKAGFQHEDLGKVTLTDNQTPPGYFQGYRSHYKWDCGLTVRDWRRNVRICNVDSTTLGTANAPSLFNLLTEAYHKLVNFTGKKVIYCNAAVATELDIQAQTKQNVYYTKSERDGEIINTFRGIPIRVCDAISSTEKVLA